MYGINDQLIVNMLLVLIKSRIDKYQRRVNLRIRAGYT